LSAEKRTLKLVGQLVAHLDVTLVHVTLVHVTAANESVQVQQQLYFNDQKLDANVFLFPELEGNDLNSLRRRVPTNASRCRRSKASANIT
jgi:hypothetical protein